jgi:uncharacterized protein YehS (DUF1456 family)
MTNNDILRRLRYLLDFADAKMMSVFDLAGHQVTKEQVWDWLKKEEEPEYHSLSDTQMAIFLNGLIIEKRGKKDGPQPEPEKKLTNNIILKKLKIAFNLKAEDMLALLKLAEFQFGKHELSALFRKPGTKHYRECKDQILRYFLKGVQMKYHDNR